MNKALIIDMLEKTADELDEILGSCEYDTDEMLNVKFRHGEPVFYVYSKTTGKQKYMNKMTSKRISEFAKGYYAKRLKRVALEEKKQIESCIAILRKSDADVENVVDIIPEPLRRYIDFSDLTGEGYARRWQEGNEVVRKYRSRKKDDYHKYRTLRGEYVGSKSELIIADRLSVRGIPYHYEIAFTPEVEVDKTKPVYDVHGHVVGYETFGFSPYAKDTLHPDFYVLNKRTRKAYFWEHLGKMDDAEYCKKNFNRFMRILDAGYVIGEDLIVTHEDSKHPLMTEDIDKIIERYLQ
jgi:hypothetical protein